MPQTDLARIHRWCDARVPAHLWPQVKVEADVDTRHVTIVEVRPPWDGVGDHTRFPICRLLWTQSRREWSLYWRDRHLRFHLYPRTDPTAQVQTLLDVVGSHDDPIFFG